jgi:hypothetical protein
MATARFGSTIRRPTAAVARVVVGVRARDKTRATVNAIAATGIVHGLAGY